ncbi:MAG: FHA domain-containing protein [Methylococcales bacterium]|nr:FHA domain-containing protein [Methylococcales bacterium]
MAKLTVFFKYKAIDSYLFENGIVHIGRDETNNITIDSLAVAPAHAAIIIRDDMSTIKQLNDNFPLIINGQKVKECNLNDNDTITIGKHDIVYNTTESVAKSESFDNTIVFGKQSFDHDLDNEMHLPPASLQVMNGHNIGKILLLKKAMTRLGSNGSGVVVIAKRKDGYFVSALENIGIIAVNNTPIENNYIKLNQNDVLTINNVSLQFFLN